MTHQCRFIIPVEWSYQMMNTGLTYMPLFTEKKVVSVLRCECGKEQRRFKYTPEKEQ
jgi:hypothetical protein